MSIINQIESFITGYQYYGPYGMNPGFLIVGGVLLLAVILYFFSQSSK